MIRLAATTLLCRGLQPRRRGRARDLCAGSGGLGLSACLNLCLRAHGLRLDPCGLCLRVGGLHLRARLLLSVRAYGLRLRLGSHLRLIARPELRLRAHLGRSLRANTRLLSDGDRLCASLSLGSRAGRIGDGALRVARLCLPLLSIMLRRQDGALSTGRGRLTRGTISLLARHLASVLLIVLRAQLLLRERLLPLSLRGGGLGGRLALLISGTL